MNGIFCFLNKKCRIDKSKEMIDNLQKENDSVEQIYSATSNSTTELEARDEIKDDEVKN